MACEDCGEPDTNASLGGVEVCDRCFDRRMSAHTGLPRLPDPPPLVADVRSRAEAEISRQYLHRATHRHGWIVGDDDEVAGRLVWNDDGDNGKPYHAVVDGRTLSWEALGLALEPYEGWGFRLVIEDRVHDVRSDAEVIELHGPGARPDDA